MKWNIFSVLVLFLTSIVFSAYYSFGPSTIEYEKTWVISGQPGTRVILDGMFIVNNSYQTITAIEKSDGVELSYGKDGIIKVKYNGTLANTQLKITAKATANIHYEISLPEDSSIEITHLKTSNYTEYNEQMAAQALALTDTNSIYKTIRNLTDWTNKYITYDLSYFGKNSPAEKVFVQKKGVCVEYSHLLISMMKSIGLKTRYVSGYVYSREWQPHAWVEVELPNNMQLPVDPTFGEAQALDNSHLITYYSEDQGQVFDRLSADRKVTMEQNEIVKSTSTEHSKQRLADVSYQFDEKNNEILVQLKNNMNSGTFFTYQIEIPQEVGPGERSIIYMKPGEVREFRYTLMDSFKEGFVYQIPITVSVNDFENKYDIVIAKQNQEATAADKKSCLSAFVLLAIIGSVGLAKWRGQ